jgi:hypothetical protein
MAEPTTSSRGNILNFASEGDAKSGLICPIKHAYWRVTGATLGTDLLHIREVGGAQHEIYADAAQLTDGAIPIPMPRIVDGIEVDDMDNGYFVVVMDGTNPLKKIT